MAARLSGRTLRFPQDPYWDLLRAHAEEQAKYPHSGWAFANLELLLPEGASLLAGACEAPAAARLGGLRESSALFDHLGAQRLLERLQVLELRPDAVLADLSEELDGDPEAAAAVVNALAFGGRWLAAVRPGTLGLLSVV